MVGFYAFADASKPIRTDLDNELVGEYSKFRIPVLRYTLITITITKDARWFSREEVQDGLAHKLGSTITRQEHKKFDADEEDKDVHKDAKAVALDKPPAFRVPPRTAIAGILIRDWADGKIGAGGWSALQRGNL